MQNTREEAHKKIMRENSDGKSMKQIKMSTMDADVGGIGKDGESSDASSTTPDDEFDREGLLLLSKLNLESNVNRRPYSCMDCIYQSRCNDSSDRMRQGSSLGNSNFGRVFIGNMDAARDIEMLEKNGVKNIVCCIAEGACNSNLWHKDKLSYFRFPVSRWYSTVSGKQQTYSFQSVRNEIVSDIKTGKITKFFDPLFQWIDDAVLRGEGVLIHCLAGAHRAGTTGVAYVMHVSGAGLDESLAAVKKMRPVVSPFGHLLELLEFYDQEIHS